MNFTSRTSAVAHRFQRRLIPIEIRPHVGTALAADLADETMLNVGQTKVVGPWVAADRDRMRALIVGAIDQDAAHAALAHFSEGDLVRAVSGGHA
jgi:hypothetical protein